MTPRKRGTTNNLNMNFIIKKSMKKKIFTTLVIAVSVAFAGYNMMKSQNDGKKLSDLVSTNIEALAMGEGNSDHKYEIREEKTMEIIDDATGTYQKLTVIDCQGDGSITC